MPVVVKRQAAAAAIFQRLSAFEASKKSDVEECAALR
jgi:hypothetical protein